MKNTILTLVLLFIVSFATAQNWRDSKSTLSLIDRVETETETILNFKILQSEVAQEFSIIITYNSSRQKIVLQDAVKQGDSGILFIDQVSIYKPVELSVDWNKIKPVVEQVIGLHII